MIRQNKLQEARKIDNLVANKQLTEEQGDSLLDDLDLTEEECGVLLDEALADYNIAITDKKYLEEQIDDLKAQLAMEEAILAIQKERLKELKKQKK